MLRVALTGNVASGKSSVLAHFKSWGATVIDTDVLAREAVKPGSPVLAAVAARFGEEVLLPDGSLDRASLRRLVMGDPERRAALNAMVHPEVMRRAAALEAEATRAGAAIVVTDIPLLFEVLDPETYDAVVLVDAPEPVRRERLMKTRGLERTEADQLIGAQLPTGPKREQSDHVIDNGGSLNDLERSARAVWLALLARAGTPAVR
jgi:dephospho-CoA kinase